MTAMPRPRPPYLHREVTRHGVVVWYVHKRPGPRVRLRAPYGTPEFQTEYERAVTTTGTTPLRRPGKGTLAWLVEQYRNSAAWSALKPATRRQRDNIFRRVLAKAGTEDFANIDSRSIRNVMDAKKATPFAARNFLETMRGLFRWALDSQHIAEDPTEGFRARRPATEGFRPWTPDEVIRFERRWPLGTRERLALDLLRYTGLRRGDAARVGRQHIRDGVIVLPTEKTGELVTIPMLPDLIASIAACPSKGLTLIAQADGSPLTKESFGNWFRDAVVAAGLDGVSAHGLRKYAATRAAENGATVAELEAIFGWRGGGMASLYTRKADRIRLAKQAIHKLNDRDENGTSMSAPEIRRPHLEKKVR